MLLTIKKGDVLKSKLYSGSDRCVLEIVGSLYALSTVESHDAYGFFLTETEIQENFILPKQPKFIPKNEELYFFIGAIGEIISERFESSYPGDKKRIEIGNCFQTKEEAQEYADKFIKMLKERE